MLVTEPILLLMSMYIALIYGLLVCYYDHIDKYMISLFYFVVCILLQLPCSLRRGLSLE